jgi:hypothetical protein
VARDVKLSTWEDDEHVAILRSISDQSKRKIADYIGIAPSTLGEWCKKSPRIKEALSQDDPQRSINVFDSIYRSCHDRIMPVVETKIITDAEGKVLSKETKTKEIVIPASFQAQRYWADHRTGDTESGVTGPAFIPIPELLGEENEEVQALD